MRRAFAEDRTRSPNGVAKSDTRKFQPGLDPLERETSIANIQPLKKEDTDRMMKLINRFMKKGGLKTEEKNAFAFWKANLVVEGTKGIVHQEFMRDFWAWLLGRGKETDHAKSPWYRQSLCNDSEVSLYVDSFVTKRHEFHVKLEQLRMRHPMGINQHYLYFKYVVRGEPPDSDHFLDDWGLFLDEFEEARVLGQRERNVDKLEPDNLYEGQKAAHEMAPYGDDKRKNVGKDSRKAQKEKRLKNMTDTWQDGNSGDEQSDADDDNDPKNGNQPAKDDDEDEDVPDVVPKEDLAVVEKLDTIATLLQSIFDRPVVSPSPAIAAPAPNNVPDIQLEEALKSAAASKALIEEQNSRILKLENETRSREVAKLPVEESRAAIVAEKEKAAKYQGMLEQSAKQIEHLQAKLEEERTKRTRETADMKDMLDNYLTRNPRLEGKGKEEEDDSEEDDDKKQMTLHPDLERSLKFQEDFMKRFEAYVGNMQQRENQVVAALQNMPTNSGPLIEEVEEMKNQTAELKKALENLPVTMALGWKEIAEAQETKLSALVVAGSANSETAVTEWKKGREEDADRFKAQLQMFAQFMRATNASQAQNISKLMETHQQQLDRLSLTMPQQNQELLLEFRKEMVTTFNQQLTVMSSPVQSELSEAIAMLQQNSNEMSQFYAAMQSASQRAAQAESMFQQAQQHAAQIQSTNTTKLEYLRNAYESANRNAQAAAQQAYVAQRQNQLTNQRLGYAIDQNQGMKQAMDAAAQHQRMMFQDFVTRTQMLTKQIEYYKSEAESVPNGDELLTENEKWIMRVEGGVAPMMLEGPKTTGEKEVGYKLTDYSAATMSKIKNEKHHKLFTDVRDLETKIVNLANNTKTPLDPELIHVLSVESVHPVVLKTKLLRYQAALANWGT